MEMTTDSIITIISKCNMCYFSLQFTEKNTESLNNLFKRLVVICEASICSWEVNTWVHADSKYSTS